MDWRSEIHHLGFRAMNCEMAAWVVAAEPQAAREHLIAARSYIQTVEARLSRFRPQSELSQLNARSGQPVQVSQLLWDVTLRALDAASQTDGLYDPTILNALEAAGYDRSFDERRTTDDERGDLSLLKRPAPAFAVRGSPFLGQRAAWRDIELDPSTRTVTLPPDVRLDLGGIAKGWAADQAADQLAALGPCLVDAGGDIAARAWPPGQAGWPIGVTDPRNTEKDLALLLVRDRGVATSGVDYRRWTQNGVLQHHAIDPRTRRPAETDLLTVSVVAPDATQADLHALVSLLLGAWEGRRYLTHQRDVEGLLVCNNGQHLTTPGLEKYLFRSALSQA